MIDESSDERVARLRHLACELKLTWGPDLGAPMHRRITTKDPSVTPAEAAKLEAWSNRIVDEATSLAGFIHRECPDDDAESYAEMWQRSVRQLRQNNGEIDERQASRLLDQGMYYATK